MDIINKQFKMAITDYYSLANRGYPQKAILQLVGNKYQLDKTRRTVLFRGIFPSKENRARQKKRTKKIEGKIVFIDTYNVLYTLANYLNGQAVFIGSDGFLRDAGEIHGKTVRESIIQSSLKITLSYLRRKKPDMVYFLLDRPVSHSGDLAHYINKSLAELEIRGDARTVQSPDFELKNINHKKGHPRAIATSDSVIISGSGVKTCDLAKKIIKSVYKPVITDLREYLPCE
jgi:hypothetical protein